VEHVDPTAAVLFRSPQREIDVAVAVYVPYGGHGLTRPPTAHAAQENPVGGPIVDLLCGVCARREDSVTVEIAPTLLDGAGVDRGRVVIAVRALCHQPGLGLRAAKDRCIDAGSEGVAVGVDKPSPRVDCPLIHCAITVVVETVTDLWSIRMHGIIAVIAVESSRLQRGCSVPIVIRSVDAIAVVIDTIAPKITSAREHRAVRVVAVPVGHSAPVTVQIRVRPRHTRDQDHKRHDRAHTGVYLLVRATAYTGGSDIG